MFEDVCRARIPGAQRYWERGVALDLVAPDPEAPGGLYVAEVKWRLLSRAERAQVHRQLEQKWAACSLAARHPQVRFDVIDASNLAS